MLYNGEHYYNLRTEPLFFSVFTLENFPYWNLKFNTYWVHLQTREVNKLDFLSIVLPNLYRGDNHIVSYVIFF